MKKILERPIKYAVSWRMENDARNKVGMHALIFEYRNWWNRGN